MESKNSASAGGNIKKFLFTVLKGFAIGIAFIIPGFSGGTVAAVLGIYDELIDSVSGIAKHFRKSIKFLLPILLGMVLAVAVLFFPIKYALEYIPLPTVLLFVGLIIGGLEPMWSKVRTEKPSRLNVGGAVAALALTVGICFIPGFGDVNLGTGMPAGGYFLLVLMGALAASALVVPGISGSMLMLIFGYYKPIFDTLSAILTTPLHSILVLLLFAVGIIIGFFTMSCLMKFLLKKFPRGTYWAIFGFVIGSIPAVFCAMDWSTVTFEWWQIVLSVVMLAIGFAAAFMFVRYQKRHPRNEFAASLEESAATAENSDTESKHEHKD